MRELKLRQISPEQITPRWLNEHPSDIPFDSPLVPAVLLTGGVPVKEIGGMKYRKWDQITLVAKIFDIPTIQSALWIITTEGMSFREIGHDLDRALTALKTPETFLGKHTRDILSFSRDLELFSCPDWDSLRERFEENKVLWGGRVIDVLKRRVNPKPLEYGLSCGVEAAKAAMLTLGLFTGYELTRQVVGYAVNEIQLQDEYRSVNKKPRFIKTTI